MYTVRDHMLKTQLKETIAEGLVLGFGVPPRTRLMLTAEDLSLALECRPRAALRRATCN